MKKVVSICLLFLSFGVFAEEITNEEKKAIIKGVYDRIYAAMGTAENQPTFHFDERGEMFMAYMSKDRDGNPEITFEGKAFDVCAEFGDRRDDAIAMLIGHEIGHHRLKHHWGSEFESTYTLEALKMEFAKVDRESSKKFETQADERGGIFCYLAGYNTLGISEKLFRRLYEAYNIKPSGKYPALEERIRIAQERDSIVSTYIKVFETGNYAMLIGEYNVAIDCYEYIIGKEFHSREIYNNMGVAYFLKGVDLSDEEDIKFVYPIELDLESRLDAKGTKGMGDNVKSLFEKAKLKFEQATKFDKNYATGYVNMACALSVLGEYEDATYFANKGFKKAKKQGNKNTSRNAKLVSAIANYLDSEGDKDEAKDILVELAANKHLLAQLNLDIVNGKSLEDVEVEAVPLSWMDGSFHNGSTGTRVRERINGIKYYSLDELQGLDSKDEQIHYTRDNFVIVGTLKDSKIHVVEGKSKYFAFHRTLENYSDTTKLGLKVGSSKASIIEKYGMPNSVMSSNQGVLLCFNRSQLVMILNENDQLSSWMIWRTIDDL